MKEQMNSSLIPLGDELKALTFLADTLVRSGMLPNHIKTKEAAMAIMLKGRELQVPPMQAFSQIHVINGKPSAGAELMTALIYRNMPKAEIIFKELTNETCVINAKRAGGAFCRFEFNMEDAERAGLTKNQSWQKFPRAMLRSRCVSEMARSLFPDACMGISYTPEELGAEVNEDGEIIDVNTREENKGTKESKAKDSNTSGVGTKSGHVSAGHTRARDAAEEFVETLVLAEEEAKAREAKEEITDRPTLPTDLKELQKLAQSHSWANQDVTKAIRKLVHKSKAADCTFNELKVVREFITGHSVGELDRV